MTIYYKLPIDYTHFRDTFNGELPTTAHHPMPTTKELPQLTDTEKEVFETWKTVAGEFAHRKWAASIPKEDNPGIAEMKRRFPSISYIKLHCAMARGLDHALGTGEFSR